MGNYDVARDLRYTRANFLHLLLKRKERPLKKFIIAAAAITTLLASYTWAAKAVKTSSEPAAAVSSPFPTPAGEQGKAEASGTANGNGLQTPAQ
jgi:hypothetical protein